MHAWTVAWVLAAVQPVEPVLERLDPPRRAAVILAIIGILVTGILLVTCTMLGARWVRKVARQKPRPPRLNDDERVAENRVLRAALDEVLPRVESKDTIHMNRKRGDTRVDP